MRIEGKRQKVKGKSIEGDHASFLARVFFLTFAFCLFTFTLLLPFFRFAC